MGTLDVKRVSLASAKQETVTCYACGSRFTRVTVVELDPRRDAALLNDESALLALSAIECPQCAYMETRPIQVRTPVTSASAETRPDDPPSPSPSV